MHEDERCIAEHLVRAGDPWPTRRANLREPGADEPPPRRPRLPGQPARAPAPRPGTDRAARAPESEPCALDDTRIRFRLAAHDLRQPLQALSLYAGAFAHHATTPKARELAGQMQRAVGELSTSLDTLVDFARLEIGAIERRLEAVALRELLDEVADQVAAAAACKGLALRVECPETLTATVDRRLLACALAHLARNAVVHTAKGSIWLRVRAAGAQVVLEVADTGPGMPPPSNAPSRGLGLAIVRRAARWLGAALRIDTGPVGGTRVALTLTPEPDDAGSAVETSPH